MQDNYDTPSGALRLAAYHGDSTTVAHLIAEGVDVNIWDTHGRSALTFASGNGHFAIVKILAEAGAWIEPYDEGSIYMTPLMCAAKHGYIEIAEFLLDRGADPTRHGGIAFCTAEYYARHEFPYLAAILHRAEDEWRRSKTSRPD